MLPETLRREDAIYVLHQIIDGDCCAVVGVSNAGKSYLLRTLANTEVQRQLLEEKAGKYLFVYVDFNLMLEATEQGFNELILRSLMEKLSRQDLPDEFVNRLQRAYGTLVAPPS